MPGSYHKILAPRSENQTTSDQAKTDLDNGVGFLVSLEIGENTVFALFDDLRGSNF